MPLRPRKSRAQVETPQNAKDVYAWKEKCDASHHQISQRHRDRITVNPAGDDGIIDDRPSLLIKLLEVDRFRSTVLIIPMPM